MYACNSEIFYYFVFRITAGLFLLQPMFRFNVTNDKTKTVQQNLYLASHTTECEIKKILLKKQQQQHTKSRKRNKGKKKKLKIKPKTKPEPTSKNAAVRCGLLASLRVTFPSRSKAPSTMKTLRYSPAKCL